MAKTAELELDWTNLERFDAMTDEMIDTSDIPSLTQEFFATAKWRMPKPKVKVTATAKFTPTL